MTDGRRRPHPRLEWDILELGDLAAAWLIVQNLLDGYASVRRLVRRAQSEASRLATAGESVTRGGS